jgi:hypothetical protein
MARGYASGVATGVAVSVAAALFSPVWMPLLARWSRPAAKAAIKGGVLAYMAGRERVAELGESMSDLLAEAQTELVAEQTGDAGAGTNPGASDSFKT